MQDVTEEVHREIAKRLRELPAYHEATTDEDDTSNEEEQPVQRRKKKGLKSGIHQTGATTVVKKVTWPRKVVYISNGKPAVYQDISVPLFVQGYLITTDSQDSSIKHREAEHLKDLMLDVEMHVWVGQNPGFSLCINEPDQTRITWLDDEEKLTFCWALVWHPATSYNLDQVATRTSPTTWQQKGAYNAPARPSTHACNQGMCNKVTSHADHQHIYSY